MKGSLSVRVNDGVSDRIVTSKVRDLSFRKTAPGGHASAGCTLILPRNTFHDLGPADKLYIYDSRTAATVWEGYTDNPGMTAGVGGQSFDLTAYGGMVRASDQAERLIYRDIDLTNWEPDSTTGSIASATTEVGQFPDSAGTRSGAPAVFLQFPRGLVMPSGGGSANMRYFRFNGSPMRIGAMSGFRDAGITSSSYQAAGDILPIDAARLDAITAGTDESAFYVNLNSLGAPWSFISTSFDNTPVRTGLLRLECSIPATNVATDDLWLAVGEIAVLGQPVDRYGQPYANPRTTHWLASEIVEDLLGRLLTFCEGVTADIDTTTAEIDQLAYLDAATPAQVFDDLSLHEPDFYWGIGSTGTNGKHRFWYRAWPTTPRYEISTKDGYSAPGGEADLCNRIAINWTDTKGSTQTTIVTSTVPALGTRVRDAEPVTLPVGLGSLAGAQRVGELVLASKASPPKAATAVVRRPVVDHLRGCMVNLWEIEPGYLVRVRETGDDLRLTEMEYADADVAATLTLGTPVRSTDQLIADVSRKVSA